MSSSPIRVAALFVVAVSISLAATAADARDACDLLPTTAKKVTKVVASLGDPYCDVTCNQWPPGYGPKPSAPVPSGTAGFAFTNGSHDKCSIKISNKLGSAEFCKAETICLGPAGRTNDGGTYKCPTFEFQTVTFNPRQDCKDKTTPRFGISGVWVDASSSGEVHRAVSTSCTQTGLSDLIIQGENVALADRISFSDGRITATRRQPHPASPCQAPGCVEYMLSVDADAPLGDFHGTLGLWGRTEKTFDLKVVAATSSTCPTQAAGPRLTGSSSSASASSSSSMSNTQPAVQFGGTRTPKAKARKRCGPSDLTYTRDPAVFELTTDTRVEIDTDLVTFGCPQSAPAGTPFSGVNLTGNGIFYLRGVDEFGLGRRVEFDAEAVWLPAGRYTIVLEEMQTAPGDYNLFW